MTTAILRVSFVIFTFVLLFPVNIKTVFGQNLQNNPIIAPSGSSGEVTIRELEQISIKAKENNARLFVIARLGKAENSNRISLARLSYTKWLLLTVRHFPLQSAVFAEGSRVAGEGRIEFYLGSQLQLVTLAKVNKIPNLTCCPDYFPPTKRKSLRRQKK